MLHLKCLTVFWIRICLDNCSVICTMTLCYALYQTHSEFWHIQHSVFSGICRHIQLYSALLRHIDAFHAYWHIIMAYSASCVTLIYSQSYHMLSPSIYRAGGETLRNVDQAYSESSHIQAYSEPCATLAYSETWHTRNTGIFSTLP